MTFCPNCGKQLADGEVCTCQASAATAATAPASSNKKGLIAAVCAVVAVIAALVVVLLVLTSGGYKKPVKEISKAINSKETNVDKLASAFLPDFAASSYSKAMKILKSSDDIKDSFEEAEEALEGLYDNIEDALGKNWKVDFDFESSKVDKDELEDIAEAYQDFYSTFLEDMIEGIEDMDKYDIEDMADELGISEKQAKELCKIATSFMKKFEKATVKEAYEFKGRIVAKGKDDSWKSEKMTFRVIKLNGDWTIDYLGLLDQSGMSLSSLLWRLQYGYGIDFDF